MLSKDENLNHHSLQLGHFFLVKKQTNKQKPQEEFSLTSLEMLLSSTANQSL